MKFQLSGDLTAYNSILDYLDHMPLNQNADGPFTELQLKNFAHILDEYEEDFRSAMTDFLKGPDSITEKALNEWASKVCVIWAAFRSEGFCNMAKGTALEKIINETKDQIDLLNNLAKNTAQTDQSVLNIMESEQQRIRDRYNDRTYSSAVLAYADAEPKKLNRYAISDAYMQTKEEYKDLISRIALADDYTFTDPEQSKKLWKQILKDYKREFKRQYKSFLQGPKSLGSEDVLQWMCDNYVAYQILSSQSFNSKDLNIDGISLREAAQNSIKLAQEWSAIFPRGEEDKFMLTQVFDQNGQWLPSNERAVFKDEAVNPVFEAITQSYNEHVNRPELKKFTAPDKESNDPTDKIINHLKDYLKDLKDTDPIWKINSGAFRRLKTDISETVKALQDYKRHPVSRQLQDVRVQLQKLTKDSTAYEIAKNDAYERSNNDRDRRRASIAGKIKSYTGNLMKGMEEAFSMRETYDQLMTHVDTLHKHLNKIDNFEVNSFSTEWKTLTLNVLQSYKKFPETQMGYTNIKEQVAGAMRKLVRVMKSDSRHLSRKQIIDDDFFKDVKSELAELSKPQKVKQTAASEERSSNDIVTTYNHWKGDDDNLASAHKKHNYSVRER